MECNHVFLHQTLLPLAPGGSLLECDAKSYKKLTRTKRLGMVAVFKIVKTLGMIENHVAL